MGSRAQRVLPVAESPVDGGIDEGRTALHQLTDAIEVNVADADHLADKVRVLLGPPLT
jgi:hypothetical protein